MERKMLTHKGGYFKYWNDDWKGKRAGRYDGEKECRHIVCNGVANCVVLPPTPHKRASRPAPDL